MSQLCLNPLLWFWKSKLKYKCPCVDESPSVLTASLGPITDINPASSCITPQNWAKCCKIGQNAAICSSPSDAGSTRNKCCSWINKPWLLCATCRLQIGTKGYRTSSPPNTPQLLLPNPTSSFFTPLLCQKQQSRLGLSAARRKESISLHFPPSFSGKSCTSFIFKQFCFALSWLWSSKRRQLRGEEFCCSVCKARGCLCSTCLALERLDLLFICVL